MVRASPVSGHTMDFRFRGNHGRLRKGLRRRESRNANDSEGRWLQGFLDSGSRSLSH